MSRRIEEKPEEGRDERKKARLTLEMPVAARELMLALQERTDAASMTEVIRHALAVYEVVVDAKLKGGAFLVKFPDGVEQRIVLA
jgi:hypothetical protein